MDRQDNPHKEDFRGGIAYGRARVWDDGFDAGVQAVGEWLQGFHCPECSTPGFKAYILPTKIDDLLKDGRIEDEAKP